MLFIVWLVCGSNMAFGQFGYNDWKIDTYSTATTQIPDGLISLEPFGHGPDRKGNYILYKTDSTAKSNG